MQIMRKRMLAIIQVCVLYVASSWPRKTGSPSPALIDHCLGYVGGGGLGGVNISSIRNGRELKGNKKRKLQYVT